MNSRLLFIGIAAFFLLGGGCGRTPQVSSDNREMIVSLFTAISSRNTSWLESNARLLEERRAEGKCADEEYKALANIIAQAKSGDWKSAEEAVTVLRDSQEPTAEDLRNLESRKLGHDHAVPKTLKPARRGKGN